MSKIVTGVAAAAVLVCLPAPAQASTSGTSCPGGNSGFVMWNVNTQPYRRRQLRRRARQRRSLVCAKAIYVVTDEEGNPFQIYNFLDNKFPAKG